MEDLILRLCASFLCGSILSLTGSYIQLSSRNILASPSTLGFDGLSILWVLILHSLLLFFNISDLSIVILSLVGLPVFMIVGFLFSRIMKKEVHHERLILLGITFNLLVGAIFSLWQFLFLAFNLPFPIELWFGHFRFVERDSLLLVALTELCLIIGYFYFRKDLKLFSLGPSIYQNWKLKEQNLFKFIFISVALGTFVVVSLFGAFSFLALIFPVIARKIWFKKKDLEGEMLWGSLSNGLILMLIDALCYFFPIMGAEIPVGLIATSVGALSLIVLLWFSQKEGEFLAKSQK